MKNLMCPSRWESFMKNKNNRFLSVIINEWHLKIAALVCAVFTYFFYDMISLEERYLTIPLEIKMSDTMVPSEAYPDVVKLTVRGKGENIYLFSDDDFRATADFSGYGEPGHYVVPIVVKPHRSAAFVSDVQIEPTPKVMNLTLDWQMTKQADVVPNFVGFPVSGYEIAEIQVIPSTVEISGPESVVSLIESVSTVPVSLDGYDRSFSVITEAVSDDKSVTMESPLVRVNVTVSEVFSEKVFSPLPIELTNPPEKGTLKIEPQIGSVRLSGKQLLIDSLDDSDVAMRVELPRLQEGKSVTVPVVLTVPDGTVVSEWTPREVTVTYGEKREDDTGNRL